MDAWGSRTWINYTLVPLSWLYLGISWLRHQLYMRGILKIHHADNTPVIVIGSLHIGGTGKTPLVIALAKCLKQTGYHPAIVSRGYRGKSLQYPLAVTDVTPVAWSGDEPYLMAIKTDCPVIVDPKRTRAVAYAMENFNCDIILSDDGLTHYAMGRTLEYAVFPAKPRGNGLYFPAGCLRSSITRYKKNGKVIQAGQDFVTKPIRFVSLANEHQQLPIDHFAGQSVNAIAGIADPARFFTLLEQLGIHPCCHTFPDHHAFKPAELLFSDEKPLIMTAKDAVKCLDFNLKNAWYLEIETQLSPEFEAHFLREVQTPPLQRGSLPA